MSYSCIFEMIFLINRYYTFAVVSENVDLHQINETLFSKLCRLSHIYKAHIETNNLRHKTTSCLFSFTASSSLSAYIIWILNSTIFGGSYVLNKFSVYCDIASDIWELRDHINFPELGNYLTDCTL